VHYSNHDFMLRRAAQFIATGRALNPTALYMSVGAEEEFEAGLTKWQLASSFLRMVALFKHGAVPGLTLTTEVFPTETHLTAWPIAFMHGIQAVFAKGPLRRGR
jgi:hypothetical protein